MKYIGSKARIAKDILNAIFVDINMPTKDMIWIEPFVGGCNMMDKTQGLFKERIGNDNNIYIIAMFKALQNGWVPPAEITEEEYGRLQYSSIVSPIIGFAGVGCSYAGKWFGGYARGNNKSGTPRNYCLESKKNLLRQHHHLEGVKFLHEDYRNLVILPNSIVYCDPPYENSTKYKNKFNHKEFWKWAKQTHNPGLNIYVYVSEYKAPSDWRCIWQKKINSSLTKDTGSKKGVEKLWAPQDSSTIIINNRKTGV